MDVSVSAREVACFEAGVKFGSLYHQFAGTPVSPESAGSVARAMEAAIMNQPYCEAVSVEIDEERLAGDLVEGYAELTGKYLKAEVVVVYDSVRVTARMELEDGYPWMRVVRVED